MENITIHEVAGAIAGTVLLVYFAVLIIAPFSLRRYSINQDVSVFINKVEVQTQVWKWGMRLVHQETELVYKTQVYSTLNRQRYNAKERIKQLKKA